MTVHATVLKADMIAIVLDAVAIYAVWMGIVWMLMFMAIATLAAAIDNG
jgi:hypothetical protein